MYNHVQWLSPGLCYTFTSSLLDIGNTWSSGAVTSRLCTSYVARENVPRNAHCGGEQATLYTPFATTCFFPQYPGTYVINITLNLCSLLFQYVPKILKTAETFWNYDTIARKTCTPLSIFKTSKININLTKLLVAYYLSTQYSSKPRDVLVVVWTFDKCVHAMIM